MGSLLVRRSPETLNPELPEENQGGRSRTQGSLRNRRDGHLATGARISKNPESNPEPANYPSLVPSEQIEALFFQMADLFETRGF